MLIILCFFYYYFTSSTAFLEALTYSEVGVRMENSENVEKIHIRTRSLAPPTGCYRLLGHTTHTVTPIDFVAHMCRQVCSTKLPLGLLSSAYKNFRHLEFFLKHVFANFSYIVDLIRTKTYMDHHYTKLVNPYQNLCNIVFCLEVSSQ